MMDPEPEATFDPGFRRLTRAQFTQSLADLHGGIWQDRCTILHSEHPDVIGPDRLRRGWRHSPVRIGDSGVPFDGYTRMMAMSPPPVNWAVGFVGSTKRSLEHINSWTSGVMNLASDTYEGWVGRVLIQQPCIWENNEGITAFDSDEEVDAHCMEQFIIDFGRRAYRRPLTADEVDDYMTRYRNIPLLYADEGLNRNQLFGRALRDIIAVINLSPEFLYRIEIPTPDGELGAYEIASRLSYHFWNTMPDDALFAAAADGRLLDDDGYAEQVNRLFSDEKTDRSIREFYADYFRVHHIPDVNHQDGPNGNANVQYHTGPNNEVDHTYWNNRETHGVESSRRYRVSLSI